MSPKTLAAIYIPVWGTGDRELFELSLVGLMPGGSAGSAPKPEG